MKIPINLIPIEKHWPNAIKPFMAYQFGFHEPRPVIGKNENGNLGRFVVDFFVLCGHGSTHEKAARMAGVSLPKGEE